MSISTYLNLVSIGASIWGSPDGGESTSFVDLQCCEALELTVNAAYGTYMDFALALLPITIIKGLNMSFKNKTALCALLGLGVV